MEDKMYRIRFQVEGEMWIKASTKEEAEEKLKEAPYVRIQKDVCRAKLPKVLAIEEDDYVTNF